MSLPSVDENLSQAGTLGWSDRLMPSETAIELPKAKWKELQALGHKLERFLAARVQCWRYLKTQAPDLNLAWARLLTENAPEILTGNGVFAVSVKQTPIGWRLQHGFLEAALVQLLMGMAFGEATEGTATDRAPLPIPADANDPLWYALVRLRPLRELWDRELRRSAADDLRRILPDAWIYDEAVLPPGAIIPRLEVAHWDQVTPDFMKRRGLAWSELSSDIAEPIVTAPAILLETGANSETAVAMEWVGFYERKENRVDALGVVAVEYLPEQELIVHPVTIA